MAGMQPGMDMGFKPEAPSPYGAGDPAAPGGYMVLTNKTGSLVLTDKTGAVTLLRKAP